MTRLMEGYGNLANTNNRAFADYASLRPINWGGLYAIAR